MTIRRFYQLKDLIIKCESSAVFAHHKKNDKRFSRLIKIRNLAFDRIMKEIEFTDK